MDVYFEKIAGVAEAPGQNRPAQQDAPVGPLELEGDDGDEGAPRNQAALDENGFPLSPLQDQDELWFVQAAQLYKPIAGGVATARASGGMLIVSGVLTLLWFFLAAILGGGLMDHAVTGIIGGVLLTLGIFERSAATELSRMRSGAPARLAVNQLMLFGVIALYCGLQMRAVSEGVTAAAMSPEMAEQLAAAPEMAGMVEQGLAMGESIAHMILGFFVALSLVFQGSLALYYYSRRRRIRAFYNELPPWVSDIVRTVAAGG